MAGPSIGRPGRPTVLIVGAASRDLDALDPRGWRLGGGVTYGSVALARLGVATRALIGVDEEASAASELDFLRGEGIELRLLPLASGPVFDNQRLPDGGRIQYAHGIAAAMPASALPTDWATSDAVVLSPVAGELGDDWADALPASTTVALGWQGILRRLLAGQRVAPLPMEPRPLIRRADLNVVSAEDAMAGGRPIEELLPRPGQQLVITNGPRPAIQLIRREAGLTVRQLPVRPVRRPRDETGAGDVLLAAWAAATVATAAVGRADGAAPDRALALAIQAASLHVEEDGVAGVPSLRRLTERLLRPPVDLPATD
jgi:sugar/nucleoside kinase (ribokinase family)